jgi:uncharacterized protein (TIGR03437 family)
LGQHQGVVAGTFSPDGSPVPAFYIPITVNVHAQATIAASEAIAPPYLRPLDTRTITVTSTSPSVPITARSSADWLTVTPTTAVTPATFTVTADASAPVFATAMITIQGPGNAITFSESTSGPVWLFPHANLTFVSRAGDTSVQTMTLQSFEGPFVVTASTDWGGNWLSATVSTPAGGNPNSLLTVVVNPSGIPFGIYHGTVVASPLGNPGSPNTIPVTLSVWEDPGAPPNVTPGLIMWSSGGSQLQPSVSVSSPVPLPFSVMCEPDYFVCSPRTGITPASVYLNPTISYPGFYPGSMNITAPPGSDNTAVVPLLITVPATPIVDPISPKMAAVVNAGSLLSGPIAPGEIVSVFGTLYSNGTAGVNVGADGKVNRALYANRVLFNGIPAPLTYMSSSQINAVVPYEIGGGSVTVEIDVGGTHSAQWVLPAAASAPGVFTQNGTGQGDGAILNQDSSLNSAQQPASRGSIIQIFLTGEGTTNPPGITGEVTQLDIKTPTQPVSVQIGGVDAKVVSATTAPEAIAGLFQVNAMVPPGIPSGSVSVKVRIGEAVSQSAVTMWVK